MASKKIAPIAAAALNAVTLGAMAESKGKRSASIPVTAALQGQVLGKWDPAASKGKGAFVPSFAFDTVQRAYGIGYLADRLVNLDNLPDAEKIAAATLVYDDPKRGDVANKIKTAGRVAWMRTLDRAGIETPKAKPVEAGNGKGVPKPRKVEADKREPIVLNPKEAAAFLPPSRDATAPRDRSTVAAYLKLQLANMQLEIEKLNQSAAKTKAPAMPPEILGDVQAWIETAKGWKLA